MNDFILGVDLAQSQDFTAITILERDPVDTGKRERRPGAPSVSYGLGGHGGERIDWSQPVLTNHYQAQYLERLAKGTPYPAQVARIKELSDELHKTNGATPLLVVDQTGVGRPVVDMLRAADLTPTAITITGGDAVTQDGRDYRVPKRDLVSTVEILLDSKRLKIASGLPEATTLTSELLAFKRNVTLSGHDRYGNDVGEWRENPHDDMVLAVALAVWYGENVRRAVRRPAKSASFGGMF